MLNVRIIRNVKKTKTQNESFSLSIEMKMKLLIISNSHANGCEKIANEITFRYNKRNQNQRISHVTVDKFERRVLSIYDLC